MKHIDAVFITFVAIGFMIAIFFSGMALSDSIVSGNIEKYGAFYIDGARYEAQKIGE